MQSLTILGSTGSIGKATLSVIQQHTDKFFVHALVAKNNVAIMTEQCIAMSPKYACMISEDAARILKKNLITAGKYDIEVLSGVMHACELASTNDVDMVMSAIVGIAGLKPTFSALRAGKKILLANKETLVTGGKLFMKEANRYRACILPIDSEHNAIFQNLPEICQKSLGNTSLSECGISRIVLTASGGIFFKTPQKQLTKITPEQACVHPNWSMGRKISVDSATMMNKGLEYIEARHLFNAKPSEIEILLHPQSIVHAMVYYSDGNVLAHLAPPDMRIPIAYAMAYPKRIGLKISSNIDIYYLNKLHFDQLDNCSYPCFQLAIDADNCSQSATIILNAANEIAVEAFLRKMISFTDIPDVIRRVLDAINLNDPNDIEDILYIDQKAREKAISICVI
ncbi:1-deoxy-D-xylulose 5-phosphate reductoisomerase [Candidatus Blochmanniella pennsylvanica str. BPEN]|uniref:1-deoxy-D-xylulose 5-phosphate reductoisomerase n=1 Tax=Blochmanniella pennsylvanica (strain BPEN) TaxID=291272 RepID=DXR_BLOPB|nr:1-deoxy-D-xylulose-5-phosphate reductoisomerase [Candidatus Blochmannia pennsylvanicus]Q493C8.1 RecName: Full=1-deoxy-D-xylulose 5-phosphate reductoisomerase; Short=DXP reductoisomerase; AltName: Full=1-deoxyxylulose-5-phosphate reductoisomerase; AltName: Full=2-C-methyl-D-erythritol 4-phosphate synthase [Candidatus Blochmannia pennsylvanicus str. BPEN]AAZ40914.1 1-deoxy-D-xylulose 5-phosphate reductoisomerase [Candidatus Blochmannia pennsylvanicus str. BPEN]UOY04141.1 1-deoxy-D-xylulose-5-ph